MTDEERDRLIRLYAAGEIAWSELRQLGFDRDVDGLACLGDPGLRPPIAPMTGPSVEVRRRGIALLQERLCNPPPR